MHQGGNQNLQALLFALLVFVTIFVPVLFPFFILGLVLLILFPDARKVIAKSFPAKSNIYQFNEHNPKPMKIFTAPRKYLVMAVIGFMLAAAAAASSIVVVPAGYTGVYHLFGKVHDEELSAGIHFINPFASVELMSIRTEQYTMSVAPGEGQRYGADAIDALTKEGLKVSLDITVLYHLEEDRASDVYREIGPHYQEKILRPLVRSIIREVIAIYEAKDIYSEKREDVVKRIGERLTAGLAGRGIVVENVLLRNVILPPTLTKRIEEKLAAEQEAQKYDFILEKEQKEAERKRIEASGQRDAQRIINESLTDRYLQYLYVQNIKDRAGTIYVPTNMPLFKGI